MLSRLLSIIYILMSRETVTAKELAERFEVSVRTIYRDVENLSMAGIPVYAKKGKNGGISLMSQFVLNKMLVTKEEQNQILAALTSLQETGAFQEKELTLKLADFFHTDSLNWVAIDFSDWSGKRQEMFETIKEAILSHRVLSFDYYGQNGLMNRRLVEPAQLLFKEYTWYLSAYCLERQAMRLFKLLRMKRVEMTGEIFLPHKQKEVVYREEFCKKKDNEGSRRGQDSLNNEWQDENGLTKCTFLIDQSEACRIYDRFEEEEITVLENGDFLVQADFLVDEWVYGLIFSFGISIKVLEPDYVKEEVIKRLKKMQLRYEQD